MGWWRVGSGGEGGRGEIWDGGELRVVRGGERYGMVDDGTDGVSERLAVR